MQSGSALASLQRQERAAALDARTYEYDLSKATADEQYQALKIAFYAAAEAMELVVNRFEAMKQAQQEGDAAAIAHTREECRQVREAWKAAVHVVLQSGPVVLERLNDQEKKLASLWEAVRANPRARHGGGGAAGGFTAATYSQAQRSLQGRQEGVGVLLESCRLLIPMVPEVP